MDLVDDRTAVAIWDDDMRCTSFIKGRVALYAILRALGIGEGDEVVLPGFTCVVVPAAVCYVGATPVYHDIDPRTLQGDQASAIDAIGPHTRAVLLQHNFGSVAPHEDLLTACRSRGIAVIEDCAHSMGARVFNKPVGTLGDAAFTSLQWSKPTTTGLGGIARSDDPSLAREIKLLADNECAEPGLLRSAYLGILSSIYRNWFRPEWYWTAQALYRAAGDRGLIQGSSSVAEVSMASMPNRYMEKFGRFRKGTLHTALRVLPRQLQHRRAIHERYRSMLSDRETWLPDEPMQGEIQAALRFPLLVENRARVLELARNSRIELGDWFNAPLHPAGSRPESFGFRLGCCPVGEAASTRVINLPTHRGVTPRNAKATITFLLEHADFSPSAWFARASQGSAGTAPHNESHT